MSPIEFSIASALFIIMLGVLILYSSYIIADYYKESKDYQAKYEAVIVSRNLLMDEKSKDSLSSYMFKRKIVIKNDQPSEITGFVSIPIVFDESCSLKAFNNSIRVFDNNSNEVNFTFSDIVFCNKDGYIKMSTLKISLVLNGNENKTLFVYYSPENLIKPLSVYYSSPTNITDYVSYSVYPEEQIKTISISRLINMTNMTYEEIKKIANTHDIYVEIIPV